MNCLFCLDKLVSNVIAYGGFVTPTVTRTAEGTVTAGGAADAVGGQIIRTAEATVTAAGAVAVTVDKMTLLRNLVNRAATAAVIAAAMGSSTTAGRNASDDAHRYINLLADSIRAMVGAGGATLTLDGSAPPTTPGFHLRGGGVGNTTAATYINSTRHGYLATLGPDIVSHMITSNDAASSTPVATYKSNLEASINAIDAEVAKPVLHILINAYERMDTTGSVPYAEYGIAQAQIAAARNNVMYIDLNPSYVARGIPGADPDDLIDTDNIHQRDSGHDYMAKLIHGLAFGFPATSAAAPAGAASTAVATTASGAATASGNATPAAAVTAAGTVTATGTADAVGSSITRTATSSVTATGTTVTAVRTTATTTPAVVAGSASMSVALAASATVTGTGTATGLGGEPVIRTAAGSVTAWGTALVDTGAPPPTMPRVRRLGAVARARTLTGVPRRTLEGARP